jgi:AraC-like DNA-binding protein
LYLSWQRYDRYARWLSESTARGGNLEPIWLRTFFVVFAITIVADACFEAYSSFVHRLSYFQFFALYLWFAAVAYYLALEGWRNSQRAYSLPRLKRAPAARAPVSPAEATEWLATVRRSGFWRDSELTLPMLSEKTGLSQGQISRLVNEGLGQNFNETINRLRVDAVAKRLCDPAEARDILTIALDCGFASKASFNRAFKEYLAMTPTEYRQRFLDGLDAG